MNSLKELNVIITGRSMAEQVSELMTKHDIDHYILPKCHGVPLKFRLLEYLGFIDTKKTILAFRSDEEMRNIILKFILKYLNRKNNGIMFTIKGELNMELDNALFVGIVNAGKGEKLANIARKKCHAGATIIDARGGGADVQKFMGIEIDSNKEVVLSVMPVEQMAKIKKEIQKVFDGENTDVVTFSLPISNFNKLHQ